ncbi:MAG: flagellar basal body-associated FliL family protein [Nitrospinales bacterium]|nr:flagellar basal body-associated FliL family protein [Nitrospinales bacterium]
MAEEEAEGEGGEAAGEEEKKGLPIKLILIVVGVLALAGGGYFAYTNFFQEEAVEESAEGDKKGEEGEEGADGETKEELPPDVGVMFTMDPFVVNLAGSKGKRFLKVTTTLELSSPEVNPEFEENLQKITDSILVLLSSKSFEDVYSVQGKFKLKDEITTRVNRFLVVGHVKDAYFTEFIVQ